MTDRAEDIDALMAGPCEQFLRDCHKKWKDRTQPQAVPKILYHYTTAQVFREILTTGVFWASDIRYMNDTLEVTHASDVLKSVIKDALNAVHGSVERELLERIARTFDFTEMSNISALCSAKFTTASPNGLPMQVDAAGSQ
jgi:hypothetical protein